MPDLQIHDISPDAFIRVLERRAQNPIRSFSWWDVWQQQHSQGFTVAKSAGFDIINDVLDAVKKALKNGETEKDFIRQLQPVLIDKGWWGRKEVTDPATGEVINAQLGSPRRLGIIYDTNMRMSFAAGNWAGYQRNKGGRPYLLYDAVHDHRTRAEHRDWGGVDDGKPMCLHMDDPWWSTHYPPNGWRCRCGTRSLSEEEYLNLVAAGRCKTHAPPIAWQNVINLRTGQPFQVPKGIDPGFGYNVGQAFMAALAAAA
jgi:uncharacterized protein with gpF-like domain